MRLLIVCDYSLKYLGGAQVALIRQAEALANEGHEPILLAPDATAVDLSVDPARQVQAVEPPPSRTLPGLGLPLFKASPALDDFVNELLDTYSPDAVMLHSEFGLAATVSRAARARGLPVLHTVHTFFWRGPAIAAPFAPLVRGFHRSYTGLPNPGIKLSDRPLDSALRQMTLALATTADVVVSPSKHQAERLREAGLARVEVVSNVTEPVANPVALPALSADQGLQLAWLGRFAPEKRLDVAVQGVASTRTRADTHLHVAGGYASRRLQRLGGTQVTWHGRLNQFEAAALVERCHAVLITSNGFDNQPMVALEAFSRGRPVMVVDAKLAEEFGDAAILCESADSEGIAATIETLAASPDRIAKAAAAATKLAQQASQRAHAQRLTEIVNGVRD